MAAPRLVLGVMKITKRQLRKIIRETFAATAQEEAEKINAQTAAAAEAVEAGKKFAEALAPVTHWPGGYINELKSGEISGSLETVLNKLADERKEALEMRVAAIRAVTDRIFGFATAMAIAFAALQISYALQARGGK